MPEDLDVDRDVVEVDHPAGPHGRLDSEGQAPGGAMRPASKHEGITCCWCRWTPRASRCVRSRTCRAARCSPSVLRRRAGSVENRLGEEGQGWQVTVSALAARAVVDRRGRGSAGKVEELKELARKSRKNDRAGARDDGIRRRIGASRRRSRVPLQRHARTHQAVARRTARRGDLINKLLRAELEVAPWRDRPGVQAAPVTWNAKWMAGRCSACALVARSRNRRGTPNIQKNIIAERVLAADGLMSTEDRVQRSSRCCARNSAQRDCRSSTRAQASRSRRRRRRRRPFRVTIGLPRFAGLSPRPSATPGLRSPGE